MLDPVQRTTIPKTDWNGHAADMRSRLATWDWHWKLPKGKTKLALDFTRVSFMEPWALAMFAAHGLSMRDSGYEVFAELDPTNPSNVYFADMGLDEIFRTGASTAASRQWSESHQNTGLHVIRTEADIVTFRRSATRLTLTHCEEAADALKYVMNELARNVVQHADSPVGAIANAQHFPERKALQVAICDLGRGVRDSLRSRYPELQTDMEALRLAVLPHSSGSSTAGPYGDSSRNAGLGLFYSREIAWRAGGSFWIASGRALLGIRGDLDAVWQLDPAAPSRVYRGITDWPGTIVAMDFPVAGVENFAGILAICGKLADEARRLSGPAGVDFLGADADLEPHFTVHVAEIDEDVTRAAQLRDQELRPRLERGETIVVDFTSIRAPTQSFVHALLYDAFRVPGSLVRLSFRNCTAAAREVVKAVAAYASYRQIV